MSGQLVGEVLDAAEAGALDDLSSNAFVALIVIADRAHTATRQASVRAARIAAAIRVPPAQGTSGRTAAASQRTVERAIAELKDAGRVSVAQRGFNNGCGKARAPVYNLAPLPPPRMAEAVGTVPAKTATVSANTATVSAIQGGGLDVVIDGLIDRARDGEGSSQLASGGLHTPVSATGKPESDKCGEHGQPRRGCRRCEAWAKWDAERRAVIAAVRREWVIPCQHCSDEGMTHGELSSRCRRHPNVDDPHGELVVQ